MSSELIHGYKGGDDTLRIKFEHRDLAGKIIVAGETGAKAKWLNVPKWGGSNAIKRVKSAMGLLWSVKTAKIEGDGEINRQFENGSTLHIWIIRDDNDILDELLK